MRRAAHKATTQRDEQGSVAVLHQAGGGHPLLRPPGPVVLPYRRDMPARKQATPEDTVSARQTLLGGLARDVDIFELESELVPLHPRDNTFRGEVFLRLAADALD